MDHRLVNQSKFIKYLSTKFNFDIDIEVINFENIENVTVLPYTPDQIVDINKIILLVEREFSVPTGSLKSKSRKNEFIVPKFCIWHLLHQKEPKVFTKKWLGKIFSRGHASVISGIQTAKDMIDVNDFQYLRSIEIINNIIENHAVKKEDLQVLRNATVHLGERKLSALFCSAHKQKSQKQVQTTQRWEEREIVQY